MIETYLSYFYQSVFKKLKVSVPFLEIVKIFEYGKDILNILSKTNKEGYANIGETLVVYLGTNIN